MKNTYLTPHDVIICDCSTFWFLITKHSLVLWNAFFQNWSSPISKIIAMQHCIPWSLIKQNIFSCSLLEAISSKSTIPLGCLRVTNHRSLSNIIHISMIIITEFSISFQYRYRVDSYVMSELLNGYLVERAKNIFLDEYGLR